MVELLVENTKTYLRSRQGVVEPIIDSTVIQAVIECMLEVGEGGGGADAKAEAARHGIEGLNLGDGIYVYNVMNDVKPYDYQRTTKEWVAAHNPPKIFAGPDHKAKMYADRYHVLLQRLLLESKLVLEADASNGSLLPGQRVLTPVESLVGNTGRKLTFGLISRLQDDRSRRWSIEDLHQVYPVELEVSDVDHLVTDGCFVLAEGEMVGDGEKRFRISNIEVPAAVARQVSEEKDEVPPQIFGGNLTDEQLRVLANSEAENPEGMYVVLCETHLDSSRVLDKLADVFQGYEESAPPALYVFMGSFCSASFVPTSEGVKSYREGFERLKFMMRNLTNHVQRGTRFIFIPGPKDPGAQSLPRMPLSGYLTADLAKDIPGVIMATNPCRIRHFSR